jgi:hypothetical protein
MPFAIHDCSRALVARCFYCWQWGALAIGAAREGEARNRRGPKLRRVSGTEKDGASSYGLARGPGPYLGERWRMRRVRSRGLRSSDAWGASATGTGTSDRDAV